MNDSLAKLSYGILLLLLVLVPQVIQDQFILHLFITIFFYIILSASLSFFNRTGQLTLAQAAFMGIGAYASTLLCMKLHLPFLMTLPLSGFVSIVIALILGKIVLRARGVYFVLITFSFTEITRLIFVNWVSLFGGANGISNIPAPRIPLLFRSGVVTVSTKGSYYYLTLVVLVLSLVVLLRITKSPMGNVFRILRESELLSQSLGVDVSKYKLIGFTIASFFAGIVGCLYAHYYRYISPHAFTFWESVYVVMICVIGGFKNLKGAVIGSAVFVFLTEAVRAGKEYQLIIFGVVIIVTVIFCPGGLEGLFTRVGNRITGLRKLTALNPES